MSFYRITDPKKRDAMVEDYIATMKRLKKRDLEERMGDMHQRQELEHHWAPVVESNERMVQEILKPMKEEVTSINKYIKPEPKSEDEEDELPHKKRRVGMEYDGYGPLARQFKTRVLTNDPDIDTSFGIYFLADGRTMMGNKIVKIVGDDLFVGNEKYAGTPGLWALITGTKKNQLSKFTDEDMYHYIQLLKETNALRKNFDPRSIYPRSNGSWKWNNILKLIWNKVKQIEYDDADDDDDSDDDYQTDDATSRGSGLRDPVKSCKLYVQKKGKCYRIKTDADDVIFKRQHRLSGVGNGLFLRRGRNVYDGEGLVLGANSPFKNIPILGWIL